MRPRILKANEDLMTEGDGQYLAPELMQIPCEFELDLAKSDYFSLGTILFQLALSSFYSDFSQFITIYL